MPYSDAQRSDHGWVTVVNQGNAPASASRLGIELLYRPPPEEPGARVRDAVAEAEGELDKLPANVKDDLQLDKLRTFSAIDPSGEDPAPRRLYRQLVRKLDPDRAEEADRQALEQPGVVSLRSALQDYLRETPDGAADPWQDAPERVRAFLAHQAGGAGWTRHLRVDDVQRVLDRPPARRQDKDLQLLRDVLGRLSTEDPRYVRFLGQPVFVSMREALAAATAAEFAEPADDELIRRLQALDRYFDGIRTGPGWKRFLQTERLLNVLRVPEYQRAPADHLLIEQTRRRLDQIATDARYTALRRRTEYITFREALQRSIEDQVLVLHIRPAIEFEPFPVADPATGEPVEPDTPLTLPDDTRIPAGEYYAELNRIEEQLNAIGHSLRDEEDEVTLVESRFDQRLQAQAAPWEAAAPPADAVLEPAAVEPPQVRPPPPVLLDDLAERTRTFQADSAPPPGPDPTTAYVDVPALGARRSIRLSVPSPDPQYGFQGQVRFVADVQGWVRESNENNNVRVVDVATAPRVVRRPTEVHTVREWSKQLGDSRYFAVDLKTHLALHGTITYTRAEASGEGTATIFNNRIRLMGASASAFGPKEGLAEADAHLSVLGVSYLDLEERGSSVWMTDNAARSLDVSHSVRFAIGPIPARVKVGAHGQAGVRYGLMADSLQVSANLQPFVESSVYAQGGVDALIAGGGVQANLTLLDFRGDTQLELRLDLESGTPAYTESYGCSHRIDALNGKFSAYAYIYVPRFSLRRPVGKKTFTAKLFDWKGFNHQATLFEGKRSVPLYD